MKKLILISIIISALFASLAMAQLVPQIEYPQEANPQASKINLVKNLPFAGDTGKAAWPVVLSQVIQLVLGVTGSLAIIAFTTGGVMMVAAQGSEEMISKGKDIIFWSVLALLIIAASYALVLGVTQLEFFQ